MHDVRGKMARGAVWMLLFKLLDRSIGLLSILVLARLLTPDNFGVVAMAMSFIGILELIGAFGFDTALIQRANADRSHFDTAWTFNVIFGCGIGALMLLLSVPVANFYHQPQLTPVVCALAVGSILQGGQNIGVVMFRKDLEFGKEFKFLLTKRLATFPLTVGLAFLLRNYWALVAGMVTGRAFDLWLSYRLHPYRPRFSLAAAGELMHFSKWLLALNVLNFFRDRSADFILGRSAGPHALGIFSVSYEISNMPGNELVAPINRAVYPAYARIAHDRGALRREYLAVMSMIALAAVPAVAGLAATVNLIVPLALGPNWLDAIPIMQMLAFFGILQVLQSNAASVFMVIGRGDILTKLHLAYVLVLLALLIALVNRMGLAGAAIAYLTTALLMLPVGVRATLKVLEIKLRLFVREIWRPLTASAAMFVVAKTYASAVASTAPIPLVLFHLLRTAALGMTVYAIFVVALWMISGRPPDSAERIVWRRLQRLHGAIRKRLWNWRHRSASASEIIEESVRVDRAGLPAHDPGLEPSIDAALSWLCEAQDRSVSADGGVSRAYHLKSGWASSYPETTGYIIPTFLECATDTGREELRVRARSMLDWLVKIQLPSGAFQGGRIDSTPVVPVVFNTGQILMGLAAGEREFGGYRQSMQRAADWLLQVQDPDGCWRRFPTPFAIGDDKTYDTHTAWGLLEAARVEPNRGYGEAALANVRWALTHQRDNGWMAHCCLSNFSQPLTHTLGYALRGIWEAYRYSGERQFLDAARKTADGLLSAQRADGFLAGQLNSDWSAATSWTCLTGTVQIAWCWLALFKETGDVRYRDAAFAANCYVRRTLQLDGPASTRGGVKGSFPIDGSYSQYEYPNWAAKFLIDALRLEREVQLSSARGIANA